MAKIALLPTPTPGHLYPFCALAKTLSQRGHEVVLFSVADGARFLGEQPYEIRQIISQKLPEGSLATIKSTLLGSRTFQKIFLKESLIEIDSILQTEKFDLLIGDEIQLHGSTLAQLNSLPFITLSCAFPNIPDRSLQYPLALSGFELNKGAVYQIKNWFFLKIFDLFAASHLKIINQYRLLKSLNPFEKIEDTFSKTCHLIPILESFDYHRSFSKHQYCIGNIIDTQRETKRKILRHSSSKPLIYVSLGTLADHNQKMKLLRALEMLSDRYEFHMSWGQWLPNTDSAQARNIFLYDHIDQLDAIEQSDLVITHGGMNSVSECLYYAKPMIVIPLKFDQPGIAKRVAYQRLGETLNIKDVHPRKLQHHLQNLLNNPDIKAQVVQAQNVSRSLNGLKKAVSLCEAML